MNVISENPMQRLKINTDQMKLKDVKFKTVL